MEVANPAGFWRRLAALILDSLVVGVPVTTVVYVSTGTWDMDTPYNQVASTLYAMIVPALWTGYTVGKRIMGIRIAKIDGSEVGLGTMALRTLVGGLVYFITLGIGLIVSVILVAFREDKRSIHDLIAGTYVTKDAFEV